MARLGDLVGRSRSAVRAWERGESVPDDRSVLAALAAVLDLDEGSLYEAAGVDRPSQETRPTVEQALATLRPDQGPPADPSPTGDDLRGRGAHLRPEDEPSSRPPPPPPEEPGTGAIAVAPPAPAVAPVLGRPAPAGIGRGASYLEEPGERLRYRLRVVSTMVAVAALVVVLVWAFGEFRIALSDVWDALRGAPAG